MESLSGNQVKDLKELYKGIYDQTIDETTAALQGLSKKNLEAMKGEKKEKIKVEDEKKKPITINLPNGGTKKIFPGSSEYEAASKGELTTSKSSSSMIPDVTNIKKNEKGELSGELKKVNKSYMGVDKKVIDKQIEDDLKDPENKVKKNEVKPEVKKDKLLSTHIPIVSKTKLGSMVRPVKPGSARDKMIAKNELRHGSDSIVNKRKMNADFQSMKKGDITKADFIKQYPKSQTAIKSKLKALESYEPYDVVLDYVLSEGHADTVEEAHYVMTQMDAETIQTIVEFIGGRPDDGYIGHPNLDIKNPFAKKKIKTTVTDKSDAGKLSDINVNKVGATIGDRNMKLKKMIDDI